MKRILIFAMLIMSCVVSSAQDEFDESEFYGKIFDVVVFEEEEWYTVFKLTFFDAVLYDYEDVGEPVGVVERISVKLSNKKYQISDFFIIGNKLHMISDKESFVFTLVRDEEGNIMFKPRNYKKETESVNAPSKSHSEASEIGRYKVSGEKINGPQKGINIVKMSDNSSKKELVR